MQDRSPIALYYQCTYIDDNKYNIKSIIQATLYPFSSAESDIFNLAAVPQTSHLYSYVTYIQTEHDHGCDTILCNIPLWQ